MKIEQSKVIVDIKKAKYAEVLRIVRQEVNPMALRIGIRRVLVQEKGADINGNGDKMEWQ